MVALVMYSAEAVEPLHGGRSNRAATHFSSVFRPKLCDDRPARILEALRPGLSFNVAAEDNTEGAPVTVGSL